MIKPIPTGITVRKEYARKTCGIIRGQYEYKDWYIGITIDVTHSKIDKNSAANIIALPKVFSQYNNDTSINTFVYSAPIAIYNKSITISSWNISSHEDVELIIDYLQTAEEILSCMDDLKEHLCSLFNECGKA